MQVKDTEKGTVKTCNHGMSRMPTTDKQELNVDLSGIVPWNQMVIPLTTR